MDSALILFYGRASLAFDSSQPAGNLRQAFPQRPNESVEWLDGCLSIKASHPKQGTMAVQTDTADPFDRFHRLLYISYGPTLTQCAEISALVGSLKGWT